MVIRVYTQPIEAIVAPTACPFCNSVDVTTTSKAANVSTYWRCTACGQIWNVGRLQHGRRTSSGRFVLERTAGSELHSDEDGTLSAWHTNNSPQGR
jgi:ribosomal protein L37AE/L43A